MEARKTAVVILNWNGEAHLREFLPSVVEHTPQSVAIIVADNGSTDGSVALLRGSFQRVEVVELGQNYGFAEGYNRALDGLEYEFVILLNSDVAVTAGWVEPLVEQLQEDESIAVVAPKILSYSNPAEFEYAGAAGGYIDYLGYPFCRGRILQSLEVDRGQYDDTCDVMWVSGAAFACRLSLFSRLGGFDSDFFAHMEEIDLCWRFALQGFRVVATSQSRVYHLGGGTLAASSPRKTFLNHRNNLAMLFKCAPTSQRIVVAVVRPVLDMLAALSYLLKGQWDNFTAVFKAYREFALWHKSVSKKRKEIRTNAKQECTKIYKGSILVRYMCGVRRFDSL